MTAPSSAEPAPARSKIRPWLRGLLAGPIVFVGTFIIMAGSALWLPKGEAEVNHIVMPVVFLPAIWGALFFYTYLESRLWRAWLVSLLLIGGHLALIFNHLSAGS